MHFCAGSTGGPRLGSAVHMDCPKKCSGIVSSYCKIKVREISPEDRVKKGIGILLNSSQFLPCDVRRDIYIVNPVCII